MSCFLEMRASVDARRDGYVDRYGIVPEFKAGVHGGTVVVTEVGVLQRALVYHGDVLNTAARIQAKCNEMGCDLLASGVALTRLSPTERARFELVGPVGLRGKVGTVELYRLGESHANQVPA